MTTDERLHWLNKIEALTMERDCYKAALERIAAHGCCVMHNDSGCPGCGAKDALSRQDANYKPTTKNEGVTINSSDECDPAAHKFEPQALRCFCGKTWREKAECALSPEYNSKDPEPARCRCGATMDDEHTYYCKNAPRSEEDSNGKA